MIQRYTPCIGDSGRGPEPDMKPHETGDMVTYSDYAAAIARAEKAEAERDKTATDACSVIGDIAMDRDTYKARLEAAEAENDEINRIAMRAVEDQQKAESRLEKMVAILKPIGNAPCDCETCYCGNYGDAQNMAAWREQNALYSRALAIAEGRDDG